MTCRICHAPASFLYMSLDNTRRIALCAMCVTRNIRYALDQCRAHDPHITEPPQPPARLN